MSSKSRRTIFSMPALPLGLGAVVYFMFLRPQMRKWGTRLGEAQRRLPGDEVVPGPNFQMTHAINIDAPPEAVWPWIGQMGREHTGYYAFDRLYNQGIPSVNFIRQDIPAPEAGMAMEGGFVLMELEACRKFLLGGFNLQRVPGIVQDVSTLYLLERRRDGSTRLLVRHNAYTYGMLSLVYNLIYEVIYYLEAMRQLDHLKQYAERMTHLKS